MSEESRNRAARYRAGLDDTAGPEESGPNDTGLDQSGPDESGAPSRGRRLEDQALWVDHQIRQAIARGDFDDLPYAGRPLPHIDTARRPDWWLEQLIEREQISGVLPEALQLRKDDAALDSELDRVASESEVRDRLESFNRRVVAARRQLQGGPPVITPLRDVELDVTRWRERRRRVGRRGPTTSGAGTTDLTPRTPGRKRRWWRRRR